ncbi:MAG: PAC2 family protein [Anaerolineae bacterium]|nr:PAC2 family protein [Anaerolineae bacterium]
MADALEFTERPQAGDLVMIAGWRQWADAGSVSSGLPQHLIQRSGARRIGTIRPEGFYLFQIPGTHDLVRPIVRFEEGLPAALDTQRNEFFYTGDESLGVVIFLGDEPHLDIERYAALFLEAARSLGVTRIVSLGGVYGELPYNKARLISCVYSLPRLRHELNRLSVQFSDYHGGASLSSYLCRRAGEADQEFIGLYAFVPTYDFAQFPHITNTIQLENDFTAWHDVMRRVNYLLKTSFDLADLQRRSAQLIQLVDAKVKELDSASPQSGLHEYFNRLAEEFTETLFDPLADVWEEELRRLLGDSDKEE